MQQHKREEETVLCLKMSHNSNKIREILRRKKKERKETGECNDSLKNSVVYT